MASELPYYKFEIMPFLTGDICLERWELQGIFTNICAFYWSKNCELSLVSLRKKYDGYHNLIQELLDLDIIKIDGEYLSINFLNEQWESKETQKIVNTINGKKGGRPKKENQIETEKEPNGFNFANPNITNKEYSKEKESKEKERKEELVIENSEINSILDFFGFDLEKPKDKPKAGLALHFLKCLYKQKTIEDFNIQFVAYKKVKADGKFIHSLEKFLGTGEEFYLDGSWNSENWVKKLEESIIPETTKESKLKSALDVHQMVADRIKNQFNQGGENG